MAFGEEKRKRKNIKLVKTDNHEEEWATTPPDAEEVDELLTDLDNVLSVAAEVPGRKDEGEERLFRGCAPSVRVTEEDLKEALKAMSTPVGEAPRGLGGITLIDAGTTDAGTTKAYIPPEIRPNYRLAQKIALVSGLFFVCLMLFSYFIFSRFLNVTVKQFENKWAAHAVELKKRELRNLLITVVGSLGPGTQKKTRPSSASINKKFRTLVLGLPDVKNKRTVFAVWSKTGRGKFELMDAIPRIAASRNAPDGLGTLLGLSSGESSKLLGSMIHSLERVSVERRTGHDEGVFWPREARFPVVYVLKSIPRTGKIAGCLGVVDTSAPASAVNETAAEVKNISYLVLGVELAVFLLFVMYLFYYNWRRNNAIYNLAHHIDLMALGDLEQEISVDTGDDIAFLAKKIAAMQSCFMGAISRLRRRRNI